MSRVSAVIVVALLSQACVPRVHETEPSLIRLTRDVTIDAFPVTLHLVRPPALMQRPLLIYATGDGGWKGKDLDLFNHLASWGYALAGFSAPEYVKHLSGDAATTTPSRLARDYAAIIDAAARDLMVPSSTPVILVGVSRGAGLSVVAAGQQAVQRSLGGVVVMGLTREEEHVRWRRRRPATELAIYDYLPRLASLPLAVIQSTHDNYLPAEQARLLFGADTDRRQFHAIEARNHSFAGARPALYETLQASLEWVSRAVTPRSMEKTR